MMSRKEVQMLKTILKEGVVHLNCSEGDCDGMTSEYGRTFTSMADYREWIDNVYNWLEGSFYYQIVSKEELITDSFSYGGWGDY